MQQTGQKRKRVGSTTGGNPKKRLKRDGGKSRAAGSTTSIGPRNRGFVRTGGIYGRFQPRGPELKYFDTPLELDMDPSERNRFVTSSNGTTGYLLYIPQGTAANQRIGRKITVKSIYIRLHITSLPFKGLSAVAPETDLSLVDNRFVVYLMLDKQANGALPPSSDIFNPVTIRGALRKLENSERFQVLATMQSDSKKRTPTIVPNGPAFDVHSPAEVQYHELYKRVNIPIEYNGPSGDPAEVRSNNLFLAYGCLDTFSPVTGSIDAPMTAIGVARIRYSDV